MNCAQGLYWLKPVRLCKLPLGVVWFGLLCEVNTRYNIRHIGMKRMIAYHVFAWGVPTVGGPTEGNPYCGPKVRLELI